MVIYRELITPDGTKLVSHHRHDFVTHTDKNGKWYMIDGGIGNEYWRSSAHGDEFINEVKLSDSFDKVRCNFERYNMYSRSYVKLKDISDKWLQNIIDWFIEHNYANSWVFRLFIEEKLFRAENEIYIPEEELYQLDF